MMKRFSLWMLCAITALALCLLLPTQAEAASVNDLTYSISNGEVKITKCNTSASGALEIPSTIEGYPVTSIGNSAFEYCSSLKTVLYEGTEAQKKEITFGSYNERLLNADWHYEVESSVHGSEKCYYCPGCDKYYQLNGTEVTHHFTNYVSNKDATTTSDGTKTAKCDYCSVKSTVTDPGTMLKKDGWELSGGTWYYYEMGVLVKNAWRKDSKGWCWLTETGAMATNSWVKDSKGWCYVGTDGYCWTNRWAKDSIGWIWLDSEGSMTKSQWILDGGKWYYLDENGYMVSNQWRKDSKGWCWLTASGAMATNSWVKDSKGWCYVGADGYCWTNRWAQDSVGWVWLDSEGSMVYNRWILDGGSWYYLGSDGYMLANTTWNGYHFNASGVCTNP